MKITGNQINNFWKKVKKPTFGDTFGGCWNWTASKNTAGYGHFRADGMMQKAHRVSWVIHNGPIPDGLQVCHTCDNPSCVRPEHLFLGTQDDNIQDMVSKGRQSAGRQVGASNPSSKITEEDVKQILRELQRGDTLKVIGNRHGISFQHVSDIKRGKTWGHVKI